MHHSLLGESDYASTGEQPPSFLAQWSTRLLILSLLGIFFLTLLPFRFNFHAFPAGHRQAFFLGGSGKSANRFDIILNVLLFVPLGLGISAAFWERRKPRITALVWALAVGTMLSYAVELLQLYIPTRDSGWEDIVTNGMGSLAGALLFEVCGKHLLFFLTATESTLVSLLRWPRSVAIIAAYFSLWGMLSIPLQRESRLDNWAPDAFFLVGNESGRDDLRPWTGNIRSLQIWNRALEPRIVKQLAAGKNGATEYNPIARFDLSPSPSYLNQADLSLKLSWTANPPKFLPHPNLATFDGKSWLTSEAPATVLVTALQKTNQFSIRVVCRPITVTQINATIVSLSQPSGVINFQIAQDNANLFFILRNRVASSRYELGWTIPDVFAMDRPVDLLFSYDGSTAMFYRDGNPEPDVFRLGPGTALAKLLRRPRAAESGGYNDIYYFGVFFTGGLLLGISARDLRQNRLALGSFLTLGILMPALLLELLLSSVSGRPISWSTFILSVTLAGGGCLWVNTEAWKRSPKLQNQSAPDAYSC